MFLGSLSVLVRRSMGSLPNPFTTINDNATPLSLRPPLLPNVTLISSLYPSLSTATLKCCLQRTLLAISTTLCCWLLRFKRLRRPDILITNFASNLSNSSTRILLSAPLSKAQIPLFCVSSFISLTAFKICSFSLSKPSASWEYSSWYIGIMVSSFTFAALT